MIIDNNNLTHVILWFDVLAYIERVKRETIRCTAYVDSRKITLKFSSDDNIRCHLMIATEELQAWDGVGWKDKVDRALGALRS